MPYMHKLHGRNICRSFSKNILPYKIFYVAARRQNENFAFLNLLLPKYMYIFG